MTLSDKTDFIVKQTLTATQRRRLYMHMGINGPQMSYREIADKEHINEKTAWECIKAAKSKILHVFNPHSTPINPLKSEGPCESITYVDPRTLDKLSQDQTLSWGQPAQICMARFDKACPRCGRKKKDGFEQGNNYAYCPDDTGCTWSYCFEDET
jgi:hypothetical protein